MKRIWAAAIFGICAAVYFLAPVRFVLDSHYSMLVGENLWRHGMVRLDRNFEHPARHFPGAPAGTNLSYHVYRHGGHIYYTYPPGSSILSVPMIAAANIAGISAAHPRNGYDHEGERRIEGIAAPLVTALAAALLFLAAARILDTRRAAVVALATALASGFFSTASRVMWSHTWAVCLLSGAILLLVRAATGARARPVLLATVLSWLYFTRPTFSVSILAITLYFFVRHRRDFLPLAITGAAWLAAFVAFSLATSGHVLPPYFLLGGTFELRHLRNGLAGTLVSPARGLLIYSPAVLVACWLALRNRRTLPMAALAITAAVASALHLFSLAAWEIWAAGFCYGARYCVDFMPWIALLAALGWQASLARGGRDIVARVVAALLIAASVAMQAIGGFLPAASEWNIKPDLVDHHSPRLWDWRDAPFVRPFVSKE